MNSSKPKRSPRTTARARWQLHLKAQQSSGQTQAAYCRAQGLNPKYFSLWKRKLRVMEEPAPGVTVPEDTAAAFVPVIVQAESDGMAPDAPRPTRGNDLVLKATLRNGLAFEVAVGSPEVLVPLLTQLAALPC